MIRGAITALVTPFRDGAVYEKGFETLVDWQLTSGIAGLCPCGTTGEAPTLSASEREFLVKTCVERAKPWTPVVVGAGTNCTATTIGLVRDAKDAGADAALVVTPYYNKPSQEGLFRHYEAIASAVDLPLILYNVPSRTGVDLIPETIGRLARIDTIIGIKDATGEIARITRIRELAGPDFIQLSGDDRTATSHVGAGGQGCISVAANAFPGPFRAMIDAASAERTSEVEWLRQQLTPFFDALALETNPGPIKYALSMICPGVSAELRLPLAPVEPETAAAVRAALDGIGHLDESEADMPLAKAS